MEIILTASAPCIMDLSRTARLALPAHFNDSRPLSGKTPCRSKQTNIEGVETAGGPPTAAACSPSSALGSSSWFQEGILAILAGKARHLHQLLVLLAPATARAAGAKLYNEAAIVGCLQAEAASPSALAGAVTANGAKQSASG